MALLTTFAGTIPQNYDTYLGPLFFEPYAVDLVQRIKDNDQAAVLELACGTGRVTNHLVNKVAPGGKLFATDLNNDMLGIAKAHVQDNRTEWAVADAQALPFEANKFDLVVCQFGVMFFPDKAKAFAETFRVLKPGGRFVFNTWDALRYNALGHLTERAMEEVFPKDPPTFFMRGPHSFFDKSEIETLLQAAGFVQIEIEKVAKTSVAPSADAAVKGILEGTPLSGFLQERSREEVETARRRLKQLLVQEFGETNLQLPMQALVCEGEKPCP